MNDQTLKLLLSRLDHLTVEFHALREEVLKAVRLSEHDPEMTLTRNRKILEYLVVDVYELRYKEERGNRSLENLLVRLVKDGHVSRRLGAYASNIRELGNVGTHVTGEDLSQDDVRRSFENLTSILEWYFEQVHPEAYMKVEAAAPEEEELLRRVAEEASRREKELAEELARQEEKARRLAEEVARRREEELERTRQEAEALKRKQQEAEAESARKKAVADAARNSIAEQKAAPVPPKPTPPPIASDDLHKLFGLNSEDDPEIALARAREVLEYVVRDVFELRCKEDPGTRSMELLLQRLVKDGHLPTGFLDHARYVRVLGSVGADGEDISKEDVRISFKHLTAILAWYFERVRPEGFAKAEGPARGEEKAVRLEKEVARLRDEELERKRQEAEALKRPAEVAKAVVEAKKRVTEQTVQRPPVESVPANMTNRIGVEFLWIPPGSFMMGSEQGYPSEKPVHRVTINEGFYMGKYEVTQEQWEAVMGNNPSFFKGKNLPVDKVTWDDCIAFVARLNALKDEYTYRLPSEAEWEYAARAGTTGEYAGDVDKIAWYWKKPGGRSQPVGCKEPNAFGLFDMYGNVWEWCQDWYHDSYMGAPTDGSAWLSGGEQKYHVVRGGSFKHDPAFCRSAFRLKIRWVVTLFMSAGFRVVAVARTQAPPAP